MSKSSIPMMRWDLARTQSELGRTIEAGLLEFLVHRIGSRDLELDATSGELVFPDFIPVKALLAELLEEVDAGNIDLAVCERCRGSFDLDREDGIFGDPAQLKVFVCERCSKELTAREFYEQYLKT